MTYTHKVLCLHWHYLMNALLNYKLKWKHNSIKNSRIYKHVLCIHVAMEYYFIILKMLTQSLFEKINRFYKRTKSNRAFVVVVVVQLLSCVQLFATPWTVANQTALSIGFPKNTRVGCHFLLQGIFLS